MTSAASVARLLREYITPPGILPRQTVLGARTLSAAFSPRQGRMGGAPQMHAPSWTGIRRGVSAETLGARLLRLGRAWGETEGDDGGGPARSQPDLGGLGIEAGSGNADLDGLARAVLELAPERLPHVDEPAAELAGQLLGANRASPPGAAELELGALGRVRDCQLRQREPRAVEQPLGRDARRDGRERLGEPRPRFVPPVAPGLP